MAIVFNDNIQNRSPKDPIDQKGVFESGVWRPYNTIDEAINHPKLQYRNIGLTINILKDGVNTEYWWRDGITDEQLIEKNISISSIIDDELIVLDKTWSSEKINEELDDKASISGQIFTGDISALNLSGINTGDQNLEEVTGLGNSSSNAIQITGLTGLDTTKDGMGLVAGNGSVSVINTLAGNIIGTFSLNPETSSQPMGILGGRISISDAINQNEAITLGQVNITLDNYLPLSGGTLTGDVQQPNLPVNGNSLITKAYVDTAITGINWKTAARLKTTANISLTGIQTIDGVAGATGSRILVNNQTDSTQNGVYIMNTGAWVRADDVNDPTEIENSTVMITLGTVSKNTQWTQIALGPIVVGTSPINYGQISGAGTYTNGTGISLVGNVFSIDASYTASAARTGYLSASDWTTFNSKSPTTGGTGYIQNQFASAQSTSDFWISGNGRIGGNFGIGKTAVARFEVTGTNTVARISSAWSSTNAPLIIGDLGTSGALGFSRISDGNTTASIGYASQSEVSEFRITSAGGSGLITFMTQTTEKMRINALGLIGIATNNPTHTLTLGSTSTGIVQYNTVDQVTDYERIRQYWLSNVYNIVVDNAGTGVLRPIQLNSGGLLGVTPTQSVTGQVYASANIGSGNASIFGVRGSIGNSAGFSLHAVTILPTITQSNNTGYNALFISPFENTVGTGNKNLINLGTNSAAIGAGTHTSKFLVDNVGNTYISGNLSVGSTAQLAKIYSESLTTQLRLAYNLTNYTDLTTVNSGTLNISGPTFGTSGMSNGININPTLNGSANGDMLVALNVGGTFVQNGNGGTAIKTYSIINVGSGYTDGVYNSVPVIGGTGTGAIANITISGGILTSVNASSGVGSGYSVSDTFTVSSANVGGIGSGIILGVANLGYSGLSTYSIRHSSNIIPFADNNASLGTSALRYANVTTAQVVTDSIRQIAGTGLTFRSNASVVTNTLFNNGNWYLGAAAFDSSYKVEIVPSGVVGSGSASGLRISGQLGRTTVVGTVLRGMLVDSNARFTLNGQTAAVVDLAPTFDLGITTISTLGTITGGTGYVNGAYDNVPLVGGSGSGATARFTVAGGIVTAVLIRDGGTGYTAGNTLTVSMSNLGGSGSGFSIPVATAGLTGLTSLTLRVTGDSSFIGKASLSAAPVNPTDIVRLQDVVTSNTVKTASGTGAATTISIPHGLTGITSASFATAQARNTASAGISYVTIDATNINIIYTVAPVSGTNNLSYSIQIK